MNTTLFPQVPSIQNHCQLLGIFNDSSIIEIDSLITEQQLIQKQAAISYEAKYIDLTMLCATLSKHLISLCIPASYCFMRSENLMNIILTKHTLDDLFAYEFDIVHIFHKISSQFLHTRNATVLSILNYIYRNVYTPISLQAISQELGLAESYISSTFKKHMNLSLIDYVNTQKIICVQEALQYTKEPILLTSIHFGFSSHSYFSRLFKKYTGMSPKAYYNKYNIYTKSCYTS